VSVALLLSIETRSRRKNSFFTISGEKKPLRLSLERENARQRQFPRFFSLKKQESISLLLSIPETVSLSRFLEIKEAGERNAFLPFSSAAMAYLLHPFQYDEGQPA
jgi:hypothetical protein